MTENAWWIAAVSYLLGEHLAHRMTFTTYSHRPGYSRYHLIGILPEACCRPTRASVSSCSIWPPGRRRAAASIRWPPCSPAPG